MADIINLRQVRRRKAREADTAQAAENRVRFGRTKAQRQADEIERNRAERQLDGAKIEGASED